MILTDGFHLVSDDSLSELHRFAKNLGLHPEWFQCDSRHPHYRITTDKALNRAIGDGAKFISRRDLVRKLLDRRIQK